jgi:hypothetical protein
MDLDDRAFYILSGMAIGAVLGYLTRMLQEIRKDVVHINNDVHDIKEEVDEIDAIVKNRRERDEGGFVRFPIVADVILLSVIAMTVWAAWTTGETNSKLEDAISDIQVTQKSDEAQEVRIRKVTSCTLEFTSKTIQALNERTTYTGRASEANAKVLQAQQDFLEVILQIPPPSDADAVAALRTYTSAVAEYNVLIKKDKTKRNRFAYPTNEELASCLGVKLPEVQGDD